VKKREKKVKKRMEELCLCSCGLSEMCMSLWQQMPWKKRQQTQQQQQQSLHFTGTGTGTGTKTNEPYVIIAQWLQMQIQTHTLYQSQSPLQSQTKIKKKKKNNVMLDMYATDIAEIVDWLIRQKPTMDKIILSEQCYRILHYMEMFLTETDDDGVMNDTQEIKAVRNQMLEYTSSIHSVHTTTTFIK
jgi:hypothetical protein